MGSYLVGFHNNDANDYKSLTWNKWRRTVPLDQISWCDDCELWLHRHSAVHSIISMDKLRICLLHEVNKEIHRWTSEWQSESDKDQISRWGSQCSSQVIQIFHSEQNTFINVRIFRDCVCSAKCLLSSIDAKYVKWSFRCSTNVGQEQQWRTLFSQA